MPGRTIHTRLAVITGTEDRQHVYVALTRGADVSMLPDTAGQAIRHPAVTPPLKIPRRD